eukprot:TRINITY_DN13469_c0_g2_i1.p1 TRINITY_DN13469_c0_g2~~TRINITY_DN13469_c0_g2_i1.p1  ORF type:complete len:755 (+),score=111.20 TRINITY_DN13469_c0_g2_i1:25-2265(+)
MLAEVDEHRKEFESSEIRVALPSTTSGSEAFLPGSVNGSDAVATNDACASEEESKDNDRASNTPQPVSQLSEFTRRCSLRPADTEQSLKSQASDFEEFIDNQLVALKAQLLHYHKRQTATLTKKLPTFLEAKAEKDVGEKGVAKPGERKQSSSSLLGRKISAVHGLSFEAFQGLAPKRDASRNVAFHGKSVSASAFHTNTETHPMWSRFVLKESNLFRQVWSQSVVTCLILYVATVFPYKLAFLDFQICADSNDEPVGWVVVQATIDILFWVDLVISFFMSHRNEEDYEVCDVRLSAQRYLKGTFIVDLIACLPNEFFQAMMDFGKASSRTSPTRAMNLTKLQRLTRLVRLLRLRQIVKLGELEWFRAIVRYRGFRMGGLAVGVVWVVHFMASGWYICAALHENPTQVSWVAQRELRDGTFLVNQPPEVQWIHAMYFVLTVFTTVGFGDMSALTTGEIFYVCMLMMIGVVINGMFLSNVMNILGETNRKDRIVSGYTNTLQDFADHTQLGSSVAYQMVMRARSRRPGAELDSAEVKKLFGGLILPRDIIQELPIKLWKGRLLKNDVFQRVQRIGEWNQFPPRMILYIAAMLKLREFDREEIIYRAGDLPMNMFLMIAGVCAFVAVPQCQVSKEMAPYQLLATRSYFGEAELLSRAESRKATVRCESASASALVLAKEDLFKLADDFPAFISVLRVLARRREEARKRRLAKHTKHRTCEQLSFDIISDYARQLASRRPRGGEAKLLD